MTARQMSAALRSLASQQPVDRLRFETLADDLEAASAAVHSPTGGPSDDLKLELALTSARNAIAEHSEALSHSGVA